MNLDDELARLRRRLTEVENALNRRPPDPVLLGSGHRVMFVTSDIDAMAGDTVGTGQAVDAVYNATTRSLTAGTGTPADVINYHEKSFLVGGIIEAIPKFGTWVVVDVNACAKYQ